LNARIGNYFDMVSSTGAVLAAGYVCPNKDNKPKFSAQEASNFYIKDGNKRYTSW